MALILVTSVDLERDWGAGSVTPALKAPLTCLGDNAQLRPAHFSPC
jgi:hypothetical protein